MFSWSTVWDLGVCLLILWLLFQAVDELAARATQVIRKSLSIRLVRAWLFANAALYLALFWISDR